MPERRLDYEDPAWREATYGRAHSTRVRYPNAFGLPVSPALEQHWRDLLAMYERRVGSLPPPSAVPPWFYYGDDGSRPDAWRDEWGPEPTSFQVEVMGGAWLGHALRT